MENLALIESFSEFKDEKFIDRVTLMSILEEVFRNTLKRNTERMITLILLSIQTKEIWKYGVIALLWKTAK